MTFIDLQHHWTPSALKQVTARAAGDGVPLGQVLLATSTTFPGIEDLEAQVEELSAIDGRASLSLLPGTSELAAAISADPATLVRDCNDELIEASASSEVFEPALITLPLPDSEAAINEIERIGANADVGGVMLYTSTAEWTLDEPRFQPAFEAAASRGLPVVLHPDLEMFSPAAADWNLRHSVSPMFSSSLGAIRLMLSGMLDRVPDLVLVIPHLGGILPYLGQRLVDQVGRGDAEYDVLHYLATRTYLDTCSFHPPAFRCAIDTAGVDRLVLGSDYPFRGPTKRCVDDVEAILTDESRELVLSTTAEKVLRRRRSVTR